MKRGLISLALLGTLVLSGCGFWGVRGNGRMTEEVRDIREFNKIDASGAYTIKVKVGEEPRLKISAEENLMKYIRTDVRGNTLIIDSRKSISPRKEIRIYVTTPELYSIDCSGANNVYAQDIDADNFRVELSGAGNIDLHGQTDRLRAEISGAGNIDARNLKANEVIISVSGAASADVYAKDYLDASVSGVGSIDYYGNPKKTNTSVSGVGSISRR